MANSNTLQNKLEEYRTMYGVGASNLEDCHEGVETVDVQRIYLVKIGDDKVEQATSPGDIPVLLGQGSYLLGCHLLFGRSTMRCGMNQRQEVNRCLPEVKVAIPSKDLNEYPTTHQEMSDWNSWYLHNPVRTFISASFSVIPLLSFLDSSSPSTRARSSVTSPEDSVKRRRISSSSSRIRIYFGGSRIASRRH